MSWEKDSLSALIDSINSFIGEALSVARQGGKPVLIVVGENHVNTEHMIAEAIILEIAVRKNIKTLIHELTDEMRAESDAFSFEKRMRALDFIVPLADILKMKILHMDNPEVPEEERETPSGMLQRESYMLDSVSAIAENAIIITGQTHIRAFHESKDLNEKFHVATICMPIQRPEYCYKPVSDLNEKDKFCRKRLEYNESQDFFKPRIPTGLKVVWALNQILGGNVYDRLHEKMSSPFDETGKAMELLDRKVIRLYRPGASYE